MPSIFDSDAFTRSLFFPRTDRTLAPSGAVDLFVEVAPEARIHVRIHEGPGAALVLLFHGNGEVVCDYDGTAALFAKAGASLAVADYRGYGESTGVPNFRNMLSDAPVVVGAVLATTKLPLFVMGRSLGGACAAELCRSVRDGVAGYIFESTGSDLADLVRRRALVVPEFSQEDKNTFDPLPKMAACTTKTLILHGENDEIIHVREAEATHRAITGSRLMVVPGRGHNDVSRGDDYWAALTEFMR